MDIKVAKTLQFGVSTEPSIILHNKEQLSSLRPVLDNGIVYTVGRWGKSILKSMGIPRTPVLARNAELDTLFSSVANIVNQRPVAIKSFTEEDARAITSYFLLLQRAKNTVPGVAYGTDDSVTKRHEVIRELEQIWWDKWVVTALPHLVPFRKRIKPGVHRIVDICPVEEQVISDNRIQEGDEVINSETDVAEEEKEDM